MKNRDIGIMFGLLPFLVITLTLFTMSSIENTSLTGNVVAQPYPYLQPFPSTSQMQIQQSQQPLNALNSVPGGNSDNNPLQNLQNQIDQLKATISNLHGQKLVVTERRGPVSALGGGTTNVGSAGILESTAVCNSDEVVTGGGFVSLEREDAPLDTQSSSPSGNGWKVQTTSFSQPFKAVAMCAKLT
jgi:hypothetical protein